MADVRVAQPIKIVDHDTGNEVDVSAAGNLAAEVRIALPAGTNNIGDVDVLTMPGTFAEDAASAGGETGLAILAVRNDAAASKTSADGDFSMLATDAAGRLGIADLGGVISVDDNGGSLTVDGSVSITGAVDTELPAAAALADATANPTITSVGTFAHGYNGTTWDRIRTANTGRLQVDVVTGGGVDSPTNPVASAVTSAAVAAGASANLDTADLAAKRLWQVDVTSSVAYKAVISTLANGVATTLTTIFGRAGELNSWRPPHRAWAVSGSSAGADGFRAAMTNLDTDQAADMYAHFFTADN